MKGLPLSLELTEKNEGQEMKIVLNSIVPAPSAAHTFYPVPHHRHTAFETRTIIEMDDELKSFKDPNINPTPHPLQAPTTILPGAVDNHKTVSDEKSSAQHPSSEQIEIERKEFQQKKQNPNAFFHIRVFSET